MQANCFTVGKGHRFKKQHFTCIKTRRQQPIFFLSGCYKWNRRWRSLLCKIAFSLVERDKGLIKVGLRGKASLQMLTRNHDNLPCACGLSHVQLSATPWTVAHQAPLSMGSLGKDTGVGCHFLLYGVFLSQGLNLCLLHWQADSLPLSHQGSPLMEYHSAWKKKEILSFVTIQTKLNDMLSGMGQNTEKQILYDLTYMWNLQKSTHRSRM